MSDLSGYSDEDLAGMAAQAHLRSLPDDQLQALSSSTAAPSAKAAAPSTASDVASSATSGVLKGTGALLGLPGDIDKMSAHVRHWALEKAGIISPETRAKWDAEGPSYGVDLGSAPITGAMSKGADTLADAIGGGNSHVENFKPQTTAGEYAQTAGEFLPTAAAGAITGGAASLPEIAGGLVKQGIVPALTSETAGQATKGTALEPYARFAGAVLGATPSALTSVLASRGKPLASALSQMSEEDLAAAQNLVDESRAAGAPLTLPEAVQHVTNGATSLGDVARVVENSRYGAPTMKSFYSDRPAQTNQLARGAFGELSSPADNPVAVPGAVQSAARGVVDASPEAQRLSTATDALGAETSAEQAGNVIRPALQSIYQGREGMRSALADYDYAAARAADNVFVPPEPEGYIGAEPKPVPVGFDAKQRATAAGAEPAAAFSFEPVQNAGPARAAPVNVRPVLDFLDSRLGDARGDAASALKSARDALFRDGQPDTSVSGLSNARNAISDQISSATRAGNNNVARELLAVQGQLDYALEQQPLYGQARRNFAAASQPLDVFGEGTAPGAIIKKDQFGNDYTMPTEKVAPTIQRGGPTAADQFLEAAQNAPEARDAFERYFGQKLLGSAIDQDGSINSGRLTAALAKNQDMLQRFPGVTDRLSQIASARQGLSDFQSTLVGQVADAPTFNRQAQILFNRNPLPGSEKQIGQAVGAIAARDPDAAAQMVRLYTERTFNEAQRATNPAQAQFAGPRYARLLAGNPQQAANLEAAVRALPEGDTRWQAFQNAMKIMQAQGWRAPPNSMTEFNRQIAEELGSGSGLGETLATAGSPSKWPKVVADKAQAWFYKQNTQQLARLFTEGNIDDLRALASSAPGTKRAATALTTALAPTIGQISPPAAGQGSP